MGFSRSEKYDPTVGYWTPETKPTRIFNIAGQGTPASAGDYTVTSGSIDSNREGFITAVGVGASDNTVFAVVVGTSTILTAYVGANETKVITGSAESPLGKITGGTNVQIIALNATTSATYTGFLVAKVDPIASKLVTES